jgi:hypothetical protein
MVEAHEFDFLGMTEGGSLNLFGAGIAESAEGDGGGITLLFIALEEKIHFPLAEPLFGDLNTGLGMFTFKKGGSGGGTFDEIIGFALVGVGGVEEFKDFTGGDSGSRRGKEAATGLDNIRGVTTQFPGGVNAQVPEPTLVAGLAPMGQIWVIDGSAVKISFEDFFDDRKFVEPGEDLAANLAIAEAMVEFFADIVGKTRNFAEKGVLAILRGLVGLRRGYVNNGGRGVHGRLVLNVEF